MKPKSKKVKDIITEGTERYDDIINIHDLNPDEDNIEIYGGADEDYFKDLQRQIEEDGLIEPPIVYPKTLEITRSFYQSSMKSDIFGKVDFGSPQVTASTNSNKAVPF